MASLGNILSALVSGGGAYQKASQNTAQQNDIGNALIDLSQQNQDQQNNAPPPPLAFQAPMPLPQQSPPAPMMPQQGLPSAINMPPQQPPQAPGQPSVPMQQPSPAPIQPGQEALQASQRPQQPQPRPQIPSPQGQQGAQQPQGMFNLQQLVSAIKTKNPNISGKELFGAISQASPLLNQEGKIQLQQETLSLKEKMLNDKMQMFNTAQNTRQQNADTNRENADTKRAGAGGKVGTKGLDAKDRAIDAQLQRLRAKNGGDIPPVNTPDGKFYDSLLQKKVDLREKKAKMLGADEGGEGKTGMGTQEKPIMAETQEDIDNAPSGSVISVDGQLFSKP